MFTACRIWFSRYITITLDIIYWNNRSSTSEKQTWIELGTGLRHASYSVCHNSRYIVFRSAQLPALMSASFSNLNVFVSLLFSSLHELKQQHYRYWAETFMQGCITAGCIKLLTFPACLPCRDGDFGISEAILQHCGKLHACRTRSAVLYKQLCVYCSIT